MNALSDPRVQHAIGRTFTALWQGLATAVHAGLISIASSYGILAIGIGGAIVLTAVREFGPLVAGDRSMRRTVQWLQMRLGGVVVAAVVVWWIAHALAH